MTGNEARRGRVAHRDPPQAGPGSSELPERHANAIDRYSLILQLIQVLPVVIPAVVFLVPDRWVAKLVSVVLLLGGAAWVVRLERAGGLRQLRQHHKAQAQNTVVEREIALSGTRVAQADALVRVTGEDGMINISISLHPSAIEATSAEIALAATPREPDELPAPIRR